jgi:hypothetical protein
MTGSTNNKPQTRRERLAAIAEEYTEEIHESRTRSQLGGLAPASRFAAVTSEGSIESSYASNGNLIVADSEPELAERLRQEAGEGWLAHGRVWDLDARFDLRANFDVSYAVRVGEDRGQWVHLVEVEGGEEGIHLFDRLLDAEAFQEVIRGHGGEAELRRKPVNDQRSAGLLIAAEREP